MMELLGSVFAFSKILPMFLIDVSKKENHLPIELVDLGTGTKSLLKSKDIPEGLKLSFKKECVVMLSTLITKLQERSPLKYMLARSAACLSPLEMVNNINKSECLVRFGSMVEKVHSEKWLPAQACDDAKEQYEDFISTVVKENRDKFLRFDIKKDRVDEFLGLFLHRKTHFLSLWKVAKIIFTLSHSQCAVERGFSVNKELLVENLEKTSLCGQRMVYDHMVSTKNTPQEIEISNELKKNCKLAHSKYVAALETNKANAEINQKSKKRKFISDEIANVKRKRVELEQTIVLLEKDIDKYSLKAEKKNDMSYLVKANAFRVKKTEKRELVRTLDQTLEKLEGDLKST